MPKHPDQPAEGQLIDNAAATRQLSARRAAPLAGISAARWGHIVNGYQSLGGGKYLPVRAPASTLARMAAVVGVTPDDLRKAGREDAADELVAMPPPGAAGADGNEPGLTTRQLALMIGEVLASRFSADTKLRMVGDLVEEALSVAESTDARGRTSTAT